MPTLVGNYSTPFKSHPNTPITSIPGTSPSTSFTLRAPIPHLLYNIQFLLLNKCPKNPVPLAAIKEASAPPWTIQPASAANLATSTLTAHRPASP
jgi:hypothetical protein